MSKINTIKKILLCPLALAYRLVVNIRNCMFDKGILPSEKFNIPVISVGNITVGGTGKTPLIEYLIRLLKEDNKVGVLSRGYKRKTRGYLLANANSTSSDIGDEPCQIKRKYPDIMVAVDANRRRGIHNMLENERAKPDLILLDDAYQHRYVIPGLSILLVDYNRLITEDYLLPVGSLREPVNAKDRADIVIITKCPPGITPIEVRIITKNIRLFPYQRLYFTSVAYGDLLPVFPKKFSKKREVKKLREEGCSVLSISGIASPRPFERYVRRNSKELVPIRFKDHHDFNKKDMMKIQEMYKAIGNKNKIIITTEKDAIRIRHNKFFPEALKKNIYYLPLTVHFLCNQEAAFCQQVKNSVKRRFF
jgi:tetraacyldisaccharide 4'-kinase